MVQKSIQIVGLIIFLFHLFSCTNIREIKEQGKEGIVEILFPDTVKGSIRISELDSSWRVIDSSQITNGKYILKYRHREMPTVVALDYCPNNGKEPKRIFMNNPYDINVVYGNIILDNTHTIIHATPRFIYRFSCSYEKKADSSTKGCLQIIFPDTVHGIVSLSKLKNFKLIEFDSVPIVNGKCIFQYKKKNITDEPIYLTVKPNFSRVFLQDQNFQTAWRDFLKNNTYIKVNAVPQKLYHYDMLASVSGSPETDIQLQLMANLLECRDQQGHISTAYIRKHPGSKLLLQELFQNRDSYSSTSELEQSFLLFNKDIQESSKGKALTNYMKIQKEGIARRFIYFDANGEKYDYKKCVKDKELCVIVFWASWCGPCIKEIPQLKEFYKKYKEKVALVSLSIDEDYKKWTDKMKEYPVEWLNLSGLPESKTRVVENFGITSVPSFIIINREGNIISSRYIKEGNKIRLVELDDVTYFLNKKLE